jgi:hypothetical protein
MHLRIPDDIGEKVQEYDGKDIFLGIRPEHITSRLATEEATDNF